MKKISALCLTVLFLTGCAAFQNDTLDAVVEETKSPEISIFTNETTTSSEEDMTFSESMVPDDKSEIISSTEPLLTYTPPAYDHFTPAFSELFEAEEGRNDVGTSFGGASGEGVIEILPGRRTTITVTVPESGHYDLTLRLISEDKAEGKLTCLDISYDLYTTSSKEFQAVMFEAVYLEKGANEIELSDFTESVDIDCILAVNSEKVSRLSYKSSEALCAPASKETKDLYIYLKNIYGRYTLSAQRCAQGSVSEIDTVKKSLGREPAIRFGELSGYSDGTDTGESEIMINWAKSGGIAAYSWYWQIDGSYTEAEIDIKSALSDPDTALKSQEDIEKAVSQSALSPDTLRLIEGIDRIAAQLKKFQDNSIPVMFRPLPEAGNKTFWWGMDSESYISLYKLIFTRISDYHAIDNIIWMWNGQDSEYYPGDEFCDIVTYDLYPSADETLGSGLSYMIKAQENEKMAGLSECSEFPDVDKMSRDNTQWLFACLYSGEYVIQSDVLSERRMSLDEWEKFYSSESVITKDELENYQ